MSDFVIYLDLSILCLIYRMGIEITVTSLHSGSLLTCTLREIAQIRS